MMLQLLSHARHRPVFPPIWAFLALVVLLAACTPKPTPYQPLGKKGGYEETRIKENTFRVSFKGNRSTLETVVLDYLYLRCAELTRDAGYSHFVILQDYGKTQGKEGSRGGFSLGLGFSSGFRRSGWGLGAGVPLGSGYSSVVDYRLGVFVIRMLQAKEVAKEPDALEADFLLKSIHEKIGKSAGGSS